MSCVLQGPLLFHLYMRHLGVIVMYRHDNNVCYHNYAVVFSVSLLHYCFLYYIQRNLQLIVAISLHYSCYLLISTGLLKPVCLSLFYIAFHVILVLFTLNYFSFWHVYIYIYIYKRSIIYTSSVQYLLTADKKGKPRSASDLSICIKCACFLELFIYQGRVYGDIWSQMHTHSYVITVRVRLSSDPHST